MIQLGVGSANIIYRIMNLRFTNFLNVAELEEMHGAAYISWDKLHLGI
jgi:hypothetical protein